MKKILSPEDIYDSRDYYSRAKIIELVSAFYKEKNKELVKEIEDITEKYQHAFEVQLVLDKQQNINNQMSIKKHFKLMHGEFENLLNKLKSL